MAFLRKKSTLNVPMGDLFSAIQKAFRWAEKEEDFGADGLAFYAARQFSPSALKKRLVACAIEDMPYLNLLLQLIKLPETSLDLLLPWVQVLCMVPKHHDAAWLQRISLERAKNLSDPCLGNDIVHQAARMTRMVLDKDQHPTLLQQMDPEYVPVFKWVKTNLSNPCLVLMASLLGNYQPEFYRNCILPPLPPMSVLPPLVLRELPDDVYDKHTSKGKALHRGWLHFVEKGLRLGNPLFPEGDRFRKEALEIYGDGSIRSRAIIAAMTAANKKRKTHDDAEATTSRLLKKVKPAPVSLLKPITPFVSPFTTIYTNVVQVQLKTAEWKPRVVFAENCFGSQLVIKGAMKKEHLNAQLLTEKVKILLDFPHANGREVNGSFVSNCLFKYDPLKFEYRNSRLEENVAIYTGEIPHWSDEKLGKDEILDIGLFLALALRFAIGANDTCASNLLVSNGLVYSVDDECKLTHSLPFCMFKKPLTGKSLEAYTSRLAEYRVWREVQSELRRWHAVLVLPNSLPVDFALQIAGRAQLLSSSPSHWVFGNSKIVMNL